MPNRTFLTAEWRDLALLNYEIEPDVLLPHVPGGTEIDLWDGRCFVSVVGFRFLKTRVMGLPIPFHSNFLEVNLRFYVRREVQGELRRGVVFIKEIVPRRAIAWVARVVYNENYVALPMRHAVDNASARYEWRFEGAWNRLALAGLRRLEHSRPDIRSRVHHRALLGIRGSAERFDPRIPGRAPAAGAWPRPLRSNWRVTSAGCMADKFSEALSREPASAFLADGSEILVRRGRPLNGIDA